MAHCEYLKGSTDKAMELLNLAQKSPAKSYAETGVSIPFLIYNNMGCIHHRLGKHNLAAFYFRRALLENEEVRVATQQRV